MQISKINNNNNLSFTNFKVTPESKKFGEDIINNSRYIAGLKKVDAENSKPPVYLKWVANLLKKVAPKLEGKFQQKRSFEDIVNIGNMGKEAVAMIVYPAQVLTNPDLPKEKRRFVGMYDFFVTCFSLGGAALFAWKGNYLSDKFAHQLMKSKYLSNIAKYPDAMKVAKGGSFVLGLAVQTMLFKRILAPSLAPPLAAAFRKKMDANDAKKTAKQQDKSSDLLPAGTSIAVDQNKNKIVK